MDRVLDRILDGILDRILDMILDRIFDKVLDGVLEIDNHLLGRSRRPSWSHLVGKASPLGPSGPPPKLPTHDHLCSPMMPSPRPKVKTMEAEIDMPPML